MWTYDLIPHKQNTAATHRKQWRWTAAAAWRYTSRPQHGIRAEGGGGGGPHVSAAAGSADGGDDGSCCFRVFQQGEEEGEWCCGAASQERSRGSCPAACVYLSSGEEVQLWEKWVMKRV